MVQFSVLRSDESAANPFAQIFDAIKHNHGTKKVIQTELKSLRSGMAEQVEGLQTHFTEKIQEISGRLVSVEKYMFRQNVISKMREQQARKKRQEDARTPSPQKGVRFRPATVGGLRKNQSPSSGIPSSPVLGAPLQSSPSSSAGVVALDHTHSTADNGMMYD